MVDGKGRLHPSKQVFEAQWLAQRRRPFSEHCVASIVPDGFPAYVRILHPAGGGNGKDVRWSEVANGSGRTMHRLVQFHAIAPTGHSGAGSELLLQNLSPPDNGNLPSHVLSALCEVLGRYTNTADRCLFCLWDGYGWLSESVNEGVLVFTSPKQIPAEKSYEAVPPPWGRDVLEGPRVELPHRSYLLFEGPLDAALDLGWNLTRESFVAQSPNLFWPEDHSWCAASEIDLFCTLVAGSEAMAENIVSDPRLEAWRVFPGDPVTWDSDKINT